MFKKHKPSSLFFSAVQHFTCGKTCKPLVEPPALEWQSPEIRVSVVSFSSPFLICWMFFFTKTTTNIVLVEYIGSKMKVHILDLLTLPVMDDSRPPILKPSKSLKIL